MASTAATFDRPHTLTTHNPPLNMKKGAASWHRAVRLTKRQNITIRLHVDRLEVGGGGCGCTHAPRPTGSTTIVTPVPAPIRPQGPESWHARMKRYGRAVQPIFSCLVRILVFCGGRIGIGIRGEDLYYFFRGYRL